MRKLIFIAIPLSLAGAAFGQDAPDLLSFRANTALAGMKMAAKTADEINPPEPVQGPQTPPPATGTGTNPNPPTPPPPTVVNGSACTSTGAGCAWTTTNVCRDLTYPKACEYTVKFSTDCNPNTSASVYTCSPASKDPGGTCAVGCTKLTFRVTDCKTDSDYCKLATMNSGNPDCNTKGVGGPNCNRDSWNVSCLTTFGDADCTVAGGCIVGPLTSGPGINCTVAPGKACNATQVSTPGTNDCGVKTAATGNMAVTQAACAATNTSTEAGGGLLCSASVLGLMLASAVARRFGIAV